MSAGYVESNDESSRELFYKKMIYQARLETYRYVNLVDFGFAEKRLYGRVTRHFEPMVLSRLPGTAVKNFTSVADSKTPSSALPFVVDAFEKLKQQFDKCASSGQISKSDTYLSSLKVYKAYTPPERLYGEHIKEINEGLALNIRESIPKIKNFDQFVLKLMPLLETVNRDYQFTFAAFVKSKECPINASGLAVEIADLDASNDLEKIKKFVMSPNWEFYLNACNSYGFMVDMRNPWRIVADIAGGPTLEESHKYGLKSTDQILDIAYEKAYKRKHFNRFKKTLLDLYNLAKENRVHENMECHGGHIAMRTITPKKYTIESLSTRYDDLYFLDLYFRIRFFEEESKFSDEEKFRLIDNCKDLAAIDFYMGLNSFEKILNKTLDYRGAINYIVKRRKLLAP